MPPTIRIVATAKLQRQRSQGGVQFPTGGMQRKLRARERLHSFSLCKVSRSGAMPEPTVTVRMQE